jgi:hypothetical protein
MYKVRLASSGAQFVPIGIPVVWWMTVPSLVDRNVCETMNRMCSTMSFTERAPGVGVLVHSAT